MTNNRARNLLKEVGATSADLFCTVHLNAGDRITTLYSSHPEPEPLGSWQRLGSGIVGYATDKMEIVSVRDVTADPHYLGAYLGVRSEMAVPILVGSHVAGVVNFESTIVGYFSEANMAFLVALADEVGKHFFLSRVPGSTELLIPESSLLKPGGLSDARITVTEISDALLAEIAREPLLLYKLTPRRFEQLVARIFEDLGYRVTLTPETRDGGFDILLEASVASGRLLTLVECKKWAPNRSVSVEIVRNLYGVLSRTNATQGLIVTTSRFTRDAQLEQDAVQYRMGLRDFDDLESWLKPYGRAIVPQGAPHNPGLPADAWQHR